MGSRDYCRGITRDILTLTLVACPSGNNIGGGQRIKVESVGEV
jgi:hypothetical protein